MSGRFNGGVAQRRRNLDPRLQINRTSKALLTPRQHLIFPDKLSNFQMLCIHAVTTRHLVFFTHLIFILDSPPFPRISADIWYTPFLSTIPGPPVSNGVEIKNRPFDTLVGPPRGPTSWVMLPHLRSDHAGRYI